MRLITLWSIFIGLIVGATRVAAQSADTGVGEISFYGGAPFGPINGGALVGGSFAGAFSKFGIGLVDASYASIGNKTLRSHGDSTITDSHLYDFNFSVHLRVPAKPNFAPYALVGTAFLYNPFQLRTADSNSAMSIDAKDSAFGFETGGGFRYYVRKDLGMRAEYRYTFSSQNFSRILAGFFYQFRD